MSTTTKPVTRSENFKSDQEQLLEGLQRLSESLQEMDSNSTHALSHYRQLPDVVTQARDMLQAGASLVHGTSTKYTLLGTVDQNEQMKMSEDLMKGCQFIGTGCLLLHEPSVGCSRAFRRHVKQASRAIVRTVIQLIAAFLDETAILEENVGAQKTGVVWQACNVILEKKLPIGNRTAIRRDLLTYMMECKETMDEFQELIDAGTSLEEEEEEGTKSTTSQQQLDDDADWDDFLAGKEQKYSSRELPVASACLAVVKLSRGSINLTLQACEAVGNQVQESVAGVESSELSDLDQARLEWLERLFQMACKLGDGMTDFGTDLYPPLDLATLPFHIETQIAKCICPVLDLILDATLPDGTVLEWPEEVKDLANKLKDATMNRLKEALDAVADAAKPDEL